MIQIRTAAQRACKPGEKCVDNIKEDKEEERDGKNSGGVVKEKNKRQSTARMSLL